MKTILRVVALVLSAIIGLWAVAHGVGLVRFLHAQFGDEENFQRIVEAGVFLVGGVCVLAISLEQLHCLRTHHRDESIL